MSRGLDELHGLKPKVVYTDLDGTMLGRGGAFTRDPDGRDTSEPTLALIAARSFGIDVVPCSGRRVRGLASDGRLLGLNTVIGDMGAVISYETGRRLVMNFGEYPGDDVHPARFMDESGATDLLLTHFKGVMEFHAPWAYEREYTHLFRGLIDTHQANALLADAGHGWLMIVDNGILHADYLGLGERRSHAYHLVPRGVSKGTAIALDQKERDLAPSECVAIGDSIADLEIAAEVAWLVLVGDAVAEHPELAERSAAMANVLVTERPGNLGWADCLNALTADGS